MEASHAALLKIRSAQRLPTLPADAYVSVESMAACVASGVADGVSVHSDGRVFVSTTSHFPGCTPAMLRWWFAFGCKGDAEYVRWHPEDHVSGHFSPSWYDDKRPFLPEGETHYVVEALGADAGGRRQTLRIQFKPPGDYGLDASLLKANGAEVALCARIGVFDALAGGWLDVGHFVHFTQPAVGGFELRSLFWMGDISIPADNVLRFVPGAHTLLNTRLARSAAARLIEGRSLFDLGVANFRHATEEFAILATFLAEAHRAAQGE
ncbi:hypothetical protein M885DRAFT_543253 [Pelagophyceae sp. CCMP2097]|nr:hypothetical protein M885DRAFT_543253 [Pelagophyceae sp. CCMP2097]